jgi:SAM-dependent methyltransferase
MCPGKVFAAPAPGPIHPNSAMAKFVVDFGSLGQPPQADGRLEAPAFRRNHDAIWAALIPYLGAQHGDVLELGSGTGQHVVEFARRAPQLTWWPSDIYESHLISIAAWRNHARLENLRPPQRIDLTEREWTWQSKAGSGGPLAAMLSINVLHISPWRVSENLIAGAGRLLRPDGHLFVYGPFKRDGAHTAPSNAEFDAALRAENADWGVRDVADLSALADKAGLRLAELIPMPANNLVLVFARAGRQN